MLRMLERDDGLSEGAEVFEGVIVGACHRVPGAHGAVLTRADQPAAPRPNQRHDGAAQKPMPFDTN